VGSAIISLSTRKKPSGPSKRRGVFFRTVRAAFGQRRKTLRNALMKEFDPVEIDRALSAANIDPKRRGETLTIEEFARLANQFGLITN